MALTNKSVNINGRTFAIRTSKNTINESLVHVSDSMSGKLAGIPSISTSCCCNPICMKRMSDPESICSKCFSEMTINRYSGLSNALESNYYLLTESILDDNMIPIFGNVRFVRIESFGDLGNVVQAINYLKIAAFNPDVTFAWWTKNPAFINKAMKIFCDGKKPENIIFIESSPYINVVKEKSFPWIDKVFSVFNDQYISENNVDINCGARSCMTCKRCYTKANTETNVSERLK